MSKSDNKTQPPTPDEIMTALHWLLHDIFDCPDIVRQGPHNPFNPAKSAWLGFDLISAALDEAEIEAIVDNIELPKSKDGRTVH